MSPEEKINELQGRIFQLSGDINSSMRQLKDLQAELDHLKRDAGHDSHPFSLIKTTRDVKAAGTGSSTESKSIENFIGLKLMHLVGIVVLVTGISIGVKYAIDQRLVSEEMRILAAYAAGFLLFALSARLKRRYNLFSAILFSGSMASLYFTTYAASVYYYFISPAIAFLLMVALTVYTAFMAMKYNRKEIAVIGMVGAYGIPFLVSANADKIELFFSYILLINIGVAFLAFKKSWKLMSQLALLITWMLFTGWAFFSSTPSQFAIGCLFMLLYYLLFLAGTVGSRVRRNSMFTVGDIQQILFNNAALYLGAITLLSNGRVIAELVTVTGCMLLLVSALALLSWKMFAGEFILQQTLIWQALVLLLLFIAFRWSGLVVTLLWVAVSVILFAWGVAAQKSWVRLASVLLMGVTLLKLLFFDSTRFSTVQKISCYIIIGILLLLFSFYYQKLGLSGKDSSPPGKLKQ